MKQYIDGYKKKSLTLFRLCLEAVDYGHLVEIEYKPCEDKLNCFHYLNGSIKKYYFIDLDLLDHADKLDEAIAYVQNLIEGE